MEYKIILGVWYLIGISTVLFVKYYDNNEITIRCLLKALTWGLLGLLIFLITLFVFLTDIFNLDVKLKKIMNKRII